MNENILVSFIIATYNGEKYLKKTVESALSQTGVQVEIIIIDDGSSDSSYIIAQKLQEHEEKKVVAIKNEENIGFCRTVNKGIKISRGDYVIILDQDDLLAKNHCISSIGDFDDETVMVFNDYYLIDETGKVFDTSSHCLHRNIEESDLISGNKIPAPGLMLKRSALLKIGGYPELEQFPNYGEYHTWIRMSEIGKIVFCPKNIAFYRRHESNMTNSFGDKSTAKKVAKYSIVCKEQFLKSNRVSFCEKCKTVYSILRDYIRCL
mgnify:CR=1 FL=1